MSDAIPRWFAVTVKPQHEKAVAEQLRSKCLESYTPLYTARHRWCDRTKALQLPLFPRYVFCRFGLPQRTLVLRTPGITSVVSFGDRPCPVSDEEIEGVKKMISSGQTLHLYPHIAVGQRVRIRAGAMIGLVGLLVREKTAYRLVVNVELLNRSVAVEIERELVEPIASPPTPMPMCGAGFREIHAVVA